MIFFLSFILFLCTTIRPKNRVLIFICTSLFGKVRGHSYSFIDSFLRCANISFAIFMPDNALIFPPLCFWQYDLDISSAIFIAVLLISFVHYIRWKAAPIFRTLYPWLYEVLTLFEVVFPVYFLAMKLVCQQNYHSRN